MSPVEADIIRRKLGVIIENLKALRPVRDMGREEYAGDIYKRKATERLLQELIEAAIDINTHILVRKGGEAPDDYYHSFIGMGDVAVLSRDLAERLAPSAGLRNRLVHEYDLIDHALVLDAVRMADTLYPRYVLEIENYLAGDQ
jgi:uncharacterized protein YutE (UPF0331/DUF86 family)